jgi:hypothetical protein
MASCSVPIPCSNFGVSTTKQCLGPFPAFSHRPCIRSTLYYCDQVGGGIQQMQIRTSAFKVRQILSFIPPFPFPLFFPFFYPPYAPIRPTKAQSLGILAPRKIWEWLFRCW